MDGTARGERLLKEVTVRKKKKTTHDRGERTGILRFFLSRCLTCIHFCYKKQTVNQYLSWLFEPRQQAHSPWFTVGLACESE